MDDALRPGSGIVIPVSEVQWRFSASSGPGGQHANTSNTRVEARLDLANSPSLDEHHRARLMGRLGAEVRVVCQTERSQSRNRSLALDRLEERLAGALVLKRSRRPTRATRGSQQRRLDSKSQRSDVKRKRQRPSADD
jgi:ribosome-associated protein